ncbi:MAG: hypothetical protein K0V04_09570 [Deltaproteobacteria bacterium]|nr:hypothetical protein [Deltaproteobacteria bacterium]
MHAPSFLYGCFGLSLLATACFEDEPIVDPATNNPSSTAGTTEVGTSTNRDDTSTSVGMADSTTVGPSSSSSTTSEVSATDSTSVDDTTGCQPACDGIACGMERDCGTSCGMCAPMATCAADQSYCGIPIGYYNDFGEGGDVFGSVQVGFEFEVVERSTVRQLGVIATGAGTMVRLALYADDGSGPDELLAQTGPVMLTSVGYNDYDVAARTIDAGQYWVMIHTEAITLLARTPTADFPGAAQRLGIPFGEGFPAVMTNENIVNDYRYNLYMVVED